MDVGITVMPILQMRKPSLRGMKHLLEDTQVVSLVRREPGLNAGSLAPEPIL